MASLKPSRNRVPGELLQQGKILDCLALGQFEDDFVFFDPIFLNQSEDGGEKIRKQQALGRHIDKKRAPVLHPLHVGKCFFHHNLVETGDDTETLGNLDELSCGHDPLLGFDPAENLVSENFSSVGSDYRLEKRDDVFSFDCFENEVGLFAVFLEDMDHVFAGRRDHRVLPFRFGAVSHIVGKKEQILGIGRVERKNRIPYGHRSPRPRTRPQPAPSRF